MTNGEPPRSSILPQIIVAVVIALLVGGTAPWWWGEFFGRKGGPPPENGGPIAVRCDANPTVIAPGGASELLIRATSSQNTPISSANVKVDVGGGSFSSPGGTTVIGTTEIDGGFRTVWELPSPQRQATVSESPWSSRDSSRVRPSAM